MLDRLALSSLPDNAENTQDEEKRQKLKSLIEGWHDNPQYVGVMPHGAYGPALDMYYAAVGDKLRQDKEDGKLDVSTSIWNTNYISSEFYFQPEKLVIPNRNGSTRSISVGPKDFPNTFKEDDIELLLNSTKDGTWQINRFMPYVVAGVQYGERVGAITAVIPTEHLPENRFIFVFTHIPYRNEWQRQSVDAFQVTTGEEQNPKRFIYVNLESYNPENLSSRDSQFAHDLVAIAISDASTGHVLEKAVLAQPHFTTHS